MKKSGNIKMDLVNGDVRRTLVIFSLPFVFSTLLQTMYSMVDMIIVGNIVGREGLSAVMAFFGAVFLLFPTWWFSLFTTDADVMAYAGMCIFCIVLELPAKIFMPSGHGLINGCGNVKLSFVLAFCDAFLGRIFLAWLLGSVMGWGVFGYMLGYTLATYVTSILQTVYYLSGLWKKRAKLI